MGLLFRQRSNRTLAQPDRIALTSLCQLDDFLQRNGPEFRGTRSLLVTLVSVASMAASSKTTILTVTRGLASTYRQVPSYEIRSSTTYFMASRERQLHLGELLVSARTHWLEIIKEMSRSVTPRHLIRISAAHGAAPRTTGHGQGLPRSGQVSWQRSPESNIEN